MSNYGWKITWVNYDVFDGDEIGVIGPGDISNETLDSLESDTINYKDQSVYRFDLFDDDNIHYFSGVLVGDEVCGDEPLIDWGTAYAGCTMIVTTDCNGKKDVIS
jgi:hypothetical protein